MRTITQIVNGLIKERNLEYSLGLYSQILKECKNNPEIVENEKIRQEKISFVKNNNNKLGFINNYLSTDTRLK